MGDPTLVFCVNKPCEQAVTEATQQLIAANLQVVRTFDLQVARSPYAAHIRCDCSHHGTQQCDCQMVVLLVYHEGQMPTSLVVHGHNSQTWFEIIDTPEQHADPQVQALIRQFLFSQGLSIPETKYC